MGTTQSSIARIEGGGSLPTLAMLARLAHATGTPCVWPPPESPTSTSAEPPDQVPLPGCGPHELTSAIQR
jgi:transcriptional regulator with XRE-family HTH domain